MKRKVTKAQQRAVEAKRKQAERIAFRIYEPRLKRNRENALKSLFVDLDGVQVGKLPDLAFERLREPYLMHLLGDMAAQIGGQSAERIEKEFAPVQTKAAPTSWEARLRKWYTANAGDRIVSIEDTFRTTVQTKLRNLLETMPNESIEVQTKYLFGNCLQEMGAEKWQARRIIQTESLANMADGERLSMDRLGLDLNKTWVAAFNNTRPAHAAMHGTTISMNAYFKMPNGDMMYGPHDMVNGSAENVINCSCGLIYTNT